MAISRTGWIGLLALMIVVGGCGAQSGAQPLVPPVDSTPVRTTAGPTPLATEPASLAAVTPPAKVTPKPTKAPSGGTYYKPPGWDGSSDVDCPDFDTHADALSFFKGTGGTKTNDPYRLDANHDGNPCETLQ